MSRSIRWLVRLYPRGWRERYEEEFVAMLEQRPMTLADALDVAFGALDAHLNSQLSSERPVHVVNRMRAATIAILCAYVSFVVAGMGFQKATEDPPFASLRSTHALLGISYDVIVAGSVAALLSMMAGGIPILLATLKRAFAERRWNVLLLFAVPPLSLAMLIGYTLLLAKVVDAIGPLAVHDPLNVVLFLSLVGVFLLAAIASTVAVSMGVARSGINGYLYRFALVPGVIATLAMGVMFVAAIVWGIGLRAYAPELFAGDEGILATNTALTWLGIVVVMGVSTCVAGVSVLRGFSGRAASNTAR
jgi:hypothetical protein